MGGRFLCVQSAVPRRDPDAASAADLEVRATHRFMSHAVLALSYFPYDTVVRPRFLCWNSDAADDGSRVNSHSRIIQANFAVISKVPKP